MFKIDYNTICRFILGIKINILLLNYWKTFSKKWDRKAISTSKVHLIPSTSSISKSEINLSNLLRPIRKAPISLPQPKVHSSWKSKEICPPPVSLKKNLKELPFNPNLTNNQQGTTLMRISSNIEHHRKKTKSSKNWKIYHKNLFLVIHTCNMVIKFIRHLKSLIT